MSYNLCYSVRYFGLYLWFSIVILFIAGIFLGCIFEFFGLENSLRDSALKSLSMTYFLENAALFALSIVAFAAACKLSLEKTISHNYQAFSITFSREKIKFTTVLAFQLQVAAISFLLQYLLLFYDIKVSLIGKLLVDLLALFGANYVLVLRWFARNITITPKNSSKDYTL